MLSARKSAHAVLTTAQQTLWAATVTQEPRSVVLQRMKDVADAEHMLNASCAVNQTAFRRGFEPDARIRSVPTVDARTGRPHADVECNAQVTVGDVLWDAGVNAWMDVVGIECYTPALQLRRSSRLLTPSSGSSWFPIAVAPPVTSAGDFSGVMDEEKKDAGDAATVAKWVPLGELVRGRVVVVRGASLVTGAGSSLSGPIVFQLPEPDAEAGLAQLRRLLAEQRY